MWSIVAQLKLIGLADIELLSCCTMWWISKGKGKKTVSKWRQHVSLWELFSGIIKFSQKIHLIPFMKFLQCLHYIRVWTDMDVNCAWLIAWQRHTVLPIILASYHSAARSFLPCDIGGTDCISVHRLTHLSSHQAFQACFSIAASMIDFPSKD